MKTLAWLISLEHPEGGLRCWPGGAAYPEITGYCLPTLLDWGEKKLAERLAKWLLTVQNDDGAFPDMTGAARSFDTAACMEGLNRAYFELHEPDYIHAATRARNWLRTQRLPGGALRTTSAHNKTHCYTMRASGLLGDKDAAKYWMETPWGDPVRSHYAAYALEGLWLAGERDFVVACLKYSQRVVTPYNLMPYWITGDWKGRRGTDTCATAQFAILYRKAGMDAGQLLAGLQRTIQPDGALRHGVEEPMTPAWAAKFYLDLMGLDR